MITLLKSKIHRATVIEANLEYQGSCAIDVNLMIAANIREFEQLHIYNVNTGDRFITYAIESNIRGMVSLNGSAARCGLVNDKIIICTYAIVSELNDDSEPVVVMVDTCNAIQEG